MDKIEDIDRMFMDLKKTIEPYYKEIRVLQANLGIPFEIDKEEALIICWQIISMSSNQRRSSFVKDNTFLQSRNNVLQLDLYVRDAKKEEVGDNKSAFIIETKKTSEKLKILVDRFFRLGINTYHLGFLRSITDWTCIPTQFQDNRYIERWTTRFVFNYVDSIEYQEAKAVIKEINIQEDDKNE